MKNVSERWLGLLILFLCASGFGQSGPPPLPPDPLLQIFNFPTNFQAPFGVSPVAYTNIESVPFWRGNVLLAGNSNTAPSFLRYNVTETNGHTNLNFPAGSITFLYAPNWASADAVQLGTGPGEAAYLLGAGDWTTGSPNGFFGLSTDPYGTNLVFWGMSNSVATAYVNTRISWSSNIFHSVDCEFSPSNSFLYVDGALAGSGGGVTVIPATNAWTNGIFIGSDANGYEQARGAFFHMEIWDIQFGGFFSTNSWDTISNSIYAWQIAQGGGGFGMMGEMGLLNPTNCNCTNYGTNVYITNMLAMPDANGDSNTTFTFTIAGGAAGTVYDVFSARNILGNVVTDEVWTWLGQGTNCGTYYITNQPTNQTFYLLGGSPANDGSGLTIAYEHLISSSLNGDTNGTPTAWYLWHGLNPQTIGNIGAQDPDLDGILNYQEYLYGTDPQVSEGFAVWVSAPNGTSGIP